MQYQNGETWVTEDSGTTDSNGYLRLKLQDNSNFQPIGSTMSAVERIVVSAQGRYLGKTVETTLDYEGCGEGTAVGDVLDGYYLGNAVVGEPEEYSWDLSNTDASLWVGGSATVVMDVCDADAHTCEPTSAAMSHMYQDSAVVTGNASGSFTWIPAASGNYVVRLGLWNGGQMLTWVAQSYAISK